MLIFDLIVIIDKIKINYINRINYKNKLIKGRLNTYFLAIPLRKKALRRITDIAKEQSKIINFFPKLSCPKECTIAKTTDGLRKRKVDGMGKMEHLLEMRESKTMKMMIEKSPDSGKSNFGKKIDEIKGAKSLTGREDLDRHMLGADNWIDGKGIKNEMLGKTPWGPKMTRTKTINTQE